MDRHICSAQRAKVADAQTQPIERKLPVSASDTFPRPADSVIVSGFEVQTDIGVICLSDLLLPTCD